MPNPFSNEQIETLPHATPYFLLSKDKVIEKYREYKEHFPGADVHYAMKANAESHLLETLRDLGSGFEVASKYELATLEKIGVTPDKIIYGTSVKPMDHIDEFVRHGVDRFACDSFPELEKIAAHAPHTRVYARISVDDTGSVFKFSEKFGTEPGNAAAVLIRARDLGLHPYGISFHVGSQASNPKAWARALDHVAPIMNELSNVGITLEMLDLGGGFPCPYASTEEEITVAEIAKYTLEAYHALPYQPHLILEPGRGIAAASCILVSTVIARIERKEHTWLFLDAGVYNGLFETMAYQGSTRYRVTSLRPSFDAGESLFALAGPTGDSPDVITREALLPQDIGPGDKLVFHNTGAYSLTAVCPYFNGFPKPAVHFI